jgi:hypothetical protein
VTEFELSDDELEAVDELESPEEVEPDELESPEELVSDELDLDAVGAAVAVSEVLVRFADALVELVLLVAPSVVRLRLAAVVVVVVVPSAVAACETTSVIKPVANTAVTTSERFTRESRRSAASRTV